MTDYTVNDFTFNLFRALSVKEKGNLVCSPKNISDCLALIYPAAQKATAAAFQNAVGFPSAYADLLKKINKFNEALAADKEATIKTANGVWANNSFPFKSEFIRLLKEDCGAQFSSVDFKNPELVASEINEWVGQKTMSAAGEPLIKDLVKPETFNADTVMTLVSAIYYLAKFKLKFNPALTRKQPFTMSNGKQVDCQLMTRQANYSIIDTDDLEMCEVPYMGDTSLGVILPKNGTLADIEAKLTDESFKSMLASSVFADTVLMLPKFKIESEFDLKDSLCALGMEVAFTDDADFSGAIEKDTPDSSVGMKIGKAIHKAFIDTTEDGTEAAAATVVSMMKFGAAMPKKPPRKFIADRPFLYVIWHRPTSSVLFVGRHDKPSGY